MNHIVNFRKSKSVKHLIRIAVAVLIVFFTNNVYAYKVYAFDSKEINLDINTSISAGYDDNITHESSGQTLYEDYLSKLGLGLGLHFQGKGRSAHLLGNIWQSFYQKFSDFNETAGDATFTYIDEISRYDTLKFRNAYNETFNASSIEGELGRTNWRNKRLTNDMLLSYRRELGPNLSVTATYCNTYIKSDRNSEDSIKTFKNAFTVESEYVYTQVTSFTSFYEFSKTDYDGIDTGISINTIAVGIRRFITHKFFLDGLAGASLVKRTINGNEDSSNGGYVKLLVTNQFKNTNMRLSVEKHKDANVLRDAIFDSWRVSGTVTKQLLRRLNGTVVLFFGHGNYDSIKITEKLWGSDIGLKYNFTDHVAGIFNYVHSRKDVSELSEESKYIRNSVSMGLNVFF